MQSNFLHLFLPDRGWPGGRGARIPRFAVKWAVLQYAYRAKEKLSGRFRCRRRRCGRRHVSHCHVRANLLRLPSHEVAMGLGTQEKVKTAKWDPLMTSLLAYIHACSFMPTWAEFGRVDIEPPFPRRRYPLMPHRQARGLFLNNPNPLLAACCGR